MIWTIPLTPANMNEAQALVAVDDERRRPSNIECGESETVIHTVALDHRAVRIDEDREAEPVGLVIPSHFLGPLPDDH
jgi:hypothetical protein